MRIGTAVMISVVATVSATTGCRRLHVYEDDIVGRKGATRVILLDASQSISTDGWYRESAAVRSFVLTTTERGDQVILLPVTQDADAESSGHALSLRRSDQRKICDTDLDAFEIDAAKQIDSFLAEVKAQPGQHTDLLGAFRVAGEYLHNAPLGGPREVIVLSDFIQDTPGLDFATDPRLAEPTSARRLAQEVGRDSVSIGHETQVMLGEVGSKDLAHLTPLRRNAIRVFWQSYLKAGQADGTIQTDGIGQLQVRLQQITNGAEALPQACKERAMQKVKGGVGS